MEVDLRKGLMSTAILERYPDFSRPTISLEASLRKGDRTGIIAEFKRRSPSAGEIRPGATVQDIVGAYERAGVRELWLIDPYGPAGTEFYQLEAQRFVPIAPVSQGMLCSTAVPGFWINVAWLWPRERFITVRQALAQIEAESKQEFNELLTQYQQQAKAKTDLDKMIAATTVMRCAHASVLATGVASTPREYAQHVIAPPPFTVSVLPDFPIARFTPLVALVGIAKKLET